MASTMGSCVRSAAGSSILRCSSAAMPRRSSRTSTPMRAGALNSAHPPTCGHKQMVSNQVSSGIARQLVCRGYSRVTQSCRQDTAALDRATCARCSSPFELP